MTQPIIHQDPAAAMDRMYRYQTAIYDLTRKPYLLGRDTLIESLGPPEGGSILEMACGTGRNLIKAAELYPSGRFFGFDVSHVMVTKAKASSERKGLSGAITLTSGDANHFEPKQAFGLSQFDRVYISYALSMIPEWERALRSALAFTKPDGTLSIVDFGSAVDQPQWLRPFLLSWLKLFNVMPQTDLPRHAQELARETGRPITLRRLWGGYALLMVFGAISNDHRNR